MSEDDVDAFRQALTGVKPLRSDRAPLDRPKPPPRPLQLEREHDAVLREAMEAPLDEEVETGDQLLFSRPGLPRGTLRKLRRGHLSVQAELDLHGMTVDVARAAVSAFLRQARQSSLVCVRIIHGKGLGSRDGKPVLKARLAAWLRRREEVLAYNTARPVDGGTGALYVLLRHR